MFINREIFMLSYVYNREAQFSCVCVLFWVMNYHTCIYKMFEIKLKNMITSYM